MSRTVVVVEDEADILLGLRMALERQGYRIIGAASGEEALSVFGRETPDAVVLDLLLPGMDGWGLLRRLQETGWFPRVPVVVVSAYASEADRRTAEEFGCQAYLTKPFGVAELRSALGAVLRDSHPDGP